MAEVEYPRAVLRALRLIEAHASVVGVEARPDEKSGAIVATVQIKTELPNSWRADGQSPSGVRIIEPVTFRFGANYPVAAPRKDEISRKPGSETGGIIFGRYCDVTESFHVVGTLPAPPDSKFSAEEFVLGTQGLRPMLTDLIEGSGGALYPLGTWHNHLVPSGPSLKDMGTAVLLSGMQFFPLLMLIHTPARYEVLMVETIAAPSRFTSETMKPPA